MSSQSQNTTVWKAAAEAVLFKLLQEKRSFQSRPLFQRQKMKQFTGLYLFPQILLSSAIHHSAAFPQKAIDLSMAWEAEGCSAE